MSTEQSYQPEMVDQTRQQIRGLVSEIEGLARAEVSHEEFYEGFLHRVVAALAAVGGAVWTLDDEGRLTLSAQINLAETRLHESEEEQQRHGKLLRKILSGGQGAVVQPKYVNAEDDSANPTDSLLVLGILKSDTETRGLVEIFQRTGGRPAVERGYLRFVMQMCDLAEDFLKTRQLRLYTDRQAIWAQLEQFTRLAHGSLEPRATAYTLANEGRRLIDCDRVSVAIHKGRKSKIEAVSGQETFDKRSNQVTLLGKLATVVVRAGEPLWYTGDTRDLAPQVEEAVEAYVDESHSKTVVVLPLAKPHDAEEHEVENAPPHKPEYIGALIIEQINTDGIPTAMRRRVDVVSEHGCTALSNALEHNSLFLMPVWRTLGKSRLLVSARTLPKTLAAIVLVVVGIASLFFVPAEFQLHGKGTLEPVVKRDIFTQTDGQVVKVLVKHGENVKAGDVLVELQNDKLEEQLSEKIGQETANEQKILYLEDAGHDARMSAQERAKNEGDLAVARANQKDFRRQRELLEDEKKKLTVRSPIDGKVVTFKLEDLLANRPVEKGQVLMTVIDPTKDWELEVLMPEDRMGHIKRAQRDLHKKDLDVIYMLQQNRGSWLHGTIKEVQEKAEVEGEEGNTVKVLVTMNKADLDPDLITKGAGVSAKIDCGRRSLGYVWFHDVLEFIQSKILFRW
ncbi:MAG TPA: HlyD family efflux transporter periplasmic adaptor subunit [Pirellulales bacterium]|jgi:biotin carboxyl carrier protein|nr:HlyD family efflux transporter periplasmic adaptor subunit [Pirellulales bacterium]